MTTSRIVAMTAASLALTATGCSYPVFVLTQRGPAHPEGPPPSFTVFVRSTPETAEDPISGEVARKVGTALASRGVTTTPNEDEADFIMLFEYEVKAILARARLRGLSGGKTGIRTERTEGPYDHSLSLWLVDGPAYRDGGREELVWLGGAAMARVPTGGSKFLDLLVVQAVDRFPGETDGTVQVRMSLDSPRAKALR